MNASLASARAELINRAVAAQEQNTDLDATDIPRLFDVEPEVAEADIDILISEIRHASNPADIKGYQ